MIITKDEYLDMGFTLTEQCEPLLEGCINRAEYILNGLTNNRASVIVLGGGTPAELVKQAAAFQTSELLKEELSLLQSNSSDGSTSNQSGERISIGDFSYTAGSSGSGSQSSSSSSGESLNTGRTVIRLLRAAGCLYSGMGVIE